MKFLKILILCLLFILSKNAKAGTTVGYEIYYTFLSGDSLENTYNLYLNFYRTFPCDDPIPSTSSLIYIMGRSPALAVTDFYDIFISLDSVTTIPVNEYPCLTIPSNQCFEKVSYSTQVTLPIVDSSFFLISIHCCRGDSLTNLIDESTLTAISNYVEITPLAQVEMNNMPVVTDSIPFQICSNTPFQYSFTSSDIEGDQLVYELCAPPTVDGSAIPYPLPYPSGMVLPPYDFPTYNTLNPLGNDIFTLDANTGELYAYPTQTGSFLVGICVSEYRNGVLLSTMTRDLVFNVVECEPQVHANVEADTINTIGSYEFTLCNSTETQITNLSQHLDYITEFYWLINNQTYTDWNPIVSFPSSGTYTGQLFLNPGQVCADTANLIFYVVEDISVDFSATYDTCIAGPVTLSSSVQYNGLSNLQYLWDFGDNQYDSLAAVQYFYDDPGTYNLGLIISDDFACSDTVSKVIEWKPAPAVIVVAPNSEVGCAPLWVQFDNRSWPIDSTYAVIWDFGDSQQVESIDAEYSYLNPGLYTVGLSITSPIGCSIDTVFEDWILVGDAPRADFSYSPQPITELTPLVAFRDQSEAAVYWEWHFSDNGVGDLEQHPVYTFPDTGSYLVSLMIWDEYWCSDTIRQRIVVEPVLDIYFPNVFTPNSDDLNDEFRATGIFTDLSFWDLSIWNRYGELVFWTNDPMLGWNGRENNVGASAMGGTYVYRLVAEDGDGEQINHEGVVVLLR